MPHEGKASLFGGWVGDGSGRRRCSGGAHSPDGGIWTEIGAAAGPGTVREEVSIRQSCRAEASDVAKRSNLERLVVVLAPLVVINRSCGAEAGVVAVGIRGASK